MKEKGKLTFLAIVSRPPRDEETKQLEKIVAGKQLPNQSFGVSEVVLIENGQESQKLSKMTKG